MPYDNLRKGRYSEPRRAYFVTSVLAERERRYFADFTCARLVVEEMRALHEDETVSSQAWVIMPDHIHWLFQLGEEMDLSAAVKRFKARYGRNHLTIMRCATAKMCGILLGTSLPTRYVPDWWSISAAIHYRIVHYRMPYGCRTELIRTIYEPKTCE